MQKILLFSDSRASSDGIRRIIEEQLPYKIFCVYKDADLQLLLENKTFSLALVDRAVIDKTIINSIESIKASGQVFPVLIVSNKIQAQVQEQLNLFHDIHALVRPTADKNILGLVHKLLISRKVPKQNYRRFNTDQIAQMEALASGTQLVTNMYNLSKGGAYCEYDGQPVIAIGDVYRLKVYLSDTNSEYVFNAKVIWTTMKGRSSGRSGCGLKFVSARDTYHSLLTKS